MRKPSDKLSALLDSLRICAPADLADCEPFVRQLARDLPDFDSVWLDALTLNGTITHWQAEVLQSGHPEQLRVGDFLLERRLGEHTFLARCDRSRRYRVLRMLPGPGWSDETPAAPTDIRSDLAATADQDASDQATLAATTPADRLRQVLESLADRGAEVPAAAIIPSAVLASDGRSPAFAVSDYVEGWSADELLIRGGRLPPSAVAEIGRELLTVLAWLESRRLLHGDLVLRNVRLTPSGMVRLVDPFCRWLTEPPPTISDHLTLRQLEGIAPERVGEGRTAEIRSELYAVGCLLWQLLTSRPVVLSADPISRVLKQRQQDIPDPRIHVPDCPEWLARQIMALTRRTPELRPSSADAALAAWREFCRSGHSACRAVVRQMPDRRRQMATRPRRASRTGRRRHRGVFAAIALLLAVTSLAGLYQGRLPQTLRFSLLPSRPHELPVEEPTVASDVSDPEHAAASPDDGRLPEPTAEGIIALHAGQQYAPQDLDSERPIIIRSTGRPAAEIHVSPDRAWQVHAPSLTLDGVVLRTVDASASVAAGASREAVAPPNQSASRALLEVTAADLRIRGCTVHSDATAGGNSGNHTGNRTGIVWQAATSGGRITIDDSVFAGRGTSLRLQSPPEALRLNNVLFATRGTPLRVTFSESDARLLRLDFHRVTQRFAPSLLDVAVEGPGQTPVQLQVTCGECVFDPALALIRYAPPAGRDADGLHAAFTLPAEGNPAIVDPSVARMVYIDHRLNRLVVAPDEQLAADGLLYSVPTFRDSGQSQSTGKWTESELVDFEGPKLSRIMPGILADRLPRSNTAGAELPGASRTSARSLSEQRIEADE